MTKTEFIEAKKGLLIDKEEKIENERDNLRKQKEILREQKKEFKRIKKLYNDEYIAKKQFLKNDFLGNHQVETKIKEKYLSIDEIAALREKQKLPFYLRSEEIFNMVTHIVGGGLSFIGMILSVIFTIIYKNSDWLTIISMLVFGVASITLYSISSIYHGLRINKGKSVFQVLDHCTIYILIAGTYFPVTLLGLDNIFPYNIVLLAVVIILATLGVVLNATMMRKKIVKVISMVLYIAIGWGVIGFYPFMVDGNMGFNGTWLLIGGGIAYTVGSILYGIGSKKRYWHSIFHIFVDIGTILQFLSVFLYCVIGL